MIIPAKLQPEIQQMFELDRIPLAPPLRMIEVLLSSLGIRPVACRWPLTTGQIQTLAQAGGIANASIQLMIS